MERLARDDSLGRWQVSWHRRPIPKCLEDESCDNVCTLGVTHYYPPMDCTTCTAGEVAEFAASATTERLCMPFRSTDEVSSPYFKLEPTSLALLKKAHGQRRPFQVDLQAALSRTHCEWERRGTEYAATAMVTAHQLSLPSSHPRRKIDASSE